MARILCISSQVVRGHVGNSAAVFALQRLGHEAWGLPTVILSNHPGHAHVAGTPIAPALMGKMLDALDANGRLGEIDAILSGYMPSEAHVALVAETVERVRKARSGVLTYFCDPVIGDDPKGLYIDRLAAEAIRDRLLPLAHVIFPNRFELEWLSGETITDVASAIAAVRALGHKHQGVVATSIPGATDELITLHDELPPWQTRRVTSLCRVARRAHVPNGTGDLLAALFAGHALRKTTNASPLALAVAGVEIAIAASDQTDELQLIASQQTWASPTPLAVEVLPAESGS